MKHTAFNDNLNQNGNGVPQQLLLEFLSNSQVKLAI